MSDYDKFLFDLKGFLVILGVLTEEEIRTVREHTKIYVKDPDSLPTHHQAPIAGPAEFLINPPGHGRLARGHRPESGAYPIRKRLHLLLIR